MDIDMDIFSDGEVLKSTETNGHPDTVDPSVITLDRPTRKNVEPTLSDHIPSPVNPRPAAFELTSKPVPQMSTHDTNSDSASPTADSMEEMDPELLPNATVAQVVIPKPKFAPLPYSSSQSGLVYDVRMRFHAEPASQIIDEDDLHPEDPRRIHEIYEELVSAGLVEDERYPDLAPECQLWRINARHALASEICLVHSRDHYEWVKSLAGRSEYELDNIARNLDSVYIHPLTYFCATLSAGGAIEACRAVVAGHVKNAVAVIRPPGHHAEHATPGGFCFFNNVPIAAKVCQRDFPGSCRKILILDWDVHHGNGVQEAFYNDPNVLYISLHVHKNGTFYPCTDYGDHRHCGEGPGLGRNVNIPWADTGMGDGDYMYAFQHIVMPIAIEFSPDFVIVSAGFDAAEGDNLGGCHVTPPCYAHMTHMLMSLANGKIAVCLEGGYNLRSIAKSALAVTRTLMGEPPDRLNSLVPSPLGLSTIKLVERTQSRYWKCMYQKDIQLQQRAGSKRIHDVIRAWQSKIMWEEYNMTSLFILREKISRSFENQVLATLNFEERRPLLVIFHDPPEMISLPDSQTSKLELHNTWLTDGCKSYIDWAVKQGFGVIDVNIPKHITDDEETTNFVEPDSDECRAIKTKELATYLWENYIEICEATHLFFLGVGAPYAGLIDLLSNNESCTDLTTFVICFVAGNSLQAIKRPADDFIAQWYYEHSLVFVADNHHAWDPERVRKHRRKYGKLIRSPHNDLCDMLIEHKETVFRYLGQQVTDYRIALQAKPQGQDDASNPDIAQGAVNNISNVAFRLDERAIRASSLPSPLRSPVKLPPIGAFKLGSSKGSQSPTSPEKQLDGRLA